MIGITGLPHGLWNGSMGHTPRAPESVRLSGARRGEDRVRVSALAAVRVVGRATLQGHRHSGSEAHTELEPQGDHVTLGQVVTADRGLSQELHLNVLADAED